ncbi:MAG: DEAD/DEAH box helicase family protein, partial [Spirochaetes bacterium]|nr:DEAD/DEAH box helicase family protein [Spirochaetota bacterium]
ILKYSVSYSDYMPLFDFALNFGYYPIAKSILDNFLIKSNKISNYLSDFQLESFRNKNTYIETLEQHLESKRVLNDESNEIGYFAPTSFGKSSLIIDFIRKLNTKECKIGIIVPTKSLLVQTYQMIRGENLSRKLIIHDEMYKDEKSFIAIFTQERALRLLNKKDLFFDLIFIDEAHNILKKDSRSVLLSRLLATNSARNAKQKIIYLSPLVNSADNLKLSKNQIVSSHIVRFNVKEPELFELRHNNEVYQYNRFVGLFYKLADGVIRNEYIINNSGKKNFIYNYRPIKIEKLASDLCKFIPVTSRSKAIIEIENILKKEVHSDFYIIKYLKHGVVYLHGKLPDIIKEYLEYKFKTIPDLRYVIANSVILEGMNLPIDTLFIYNTHSLYGKELMNLIGRVNRLNTIFNSGENELHRLLPKVHFINNTEHNDIHSKMENKISLLRSRIFDDKVENPTLASFDASSLSNSDFEKARKIQENEEFLVSNNLSKEDEILTYLIKSGIADFYYNPSDVVNWFISQYEILKCESTDEWTSKTMMEKINHLYTNDPNNVCDFEVRRLSSSEARNYYESHILVAQKKSLKENIHSEVNHFKERAKSRNNKMYFGQSYGEVPYESNSYSNSSKNVYVDLSTKSEEQLVNLAVVKLKIEDDFISFKLNKFIVMLYDYELITADEYNLYIYGTIDVNKIDLAKFGLSISLISRLEKDGQLDNLKFDQFNNLCANSKFEEFLKSIDDFYRFELSRIIDIKEF